MKDVMNRGVATPPKILSAGDLLSMARAGTSAVHQISLRELVVPVRVLSAEEINTVRREGVVHAKKIAGDDTDVNFYCQKHILILASKVSHGQPGLLSESLVNMFSVDEINFLYNEYIKVMEDVDPNIEVFPNEKFRELVEYVKKNNAKSKDLSLLQLRAIFTDWRGMILRQDSPESPTVN